MARLLLPLYFNLNFTMRVISVIASNTWMDHTTFSFCPTPKKLEYLSLERYSVRASIWGEGPPLVLLPGLAGGYELLGPFIRELSKRFEVHSFQYLGEEDGFSLRHEFNFPQLTQDLADIISHWRLEAPNLCGVSFGGALALQFALEKPAQVGSLIIQGAGVAYERGMVQRFASLILSHYQLPHHNPMVNQFFKLFLAGKPIPQSQLDEVTRICWETDQSIISKRLRMLKNFDLRKQRRKITAPALFLRGQKDALLNSGNFAGLKAIAPQGRFQVLGSLGHLAFIQAPAEIADIAEGFIKSYCTPLETVA